MIVTRTLSGRGISPCWFAAHFSPVRFMPTPPNIPGMSQSTLEDGIRHSVVGMQHTPPGAESVYGNSVRISLNKTMGCRLSIVEPRFNVSSSRIRRSPVCRWVNEAPAVNLFSKSLCVHIDPIKTL